MSSGDAADERAPQVALDPQAAALLDQLELQNAPPIETLSPREARAGLVASIGALGAAGEAVAQVEDISIPGPTGPLPVRIYTPDASGPLPLIAFFHGGGWVVGDLETHDTICRALTNRARCVVVSVDYRLAPEHPYPAAVDDAYAAVEWMATNASRLHGDATRLVVAGDSAGGNLAAVVALVAQDKGGPALAAQALIYPVTNAASLDTGSYQAFSNGYLLTRNAMDWYRGHYLPREADRRHPYASPLLADDLSRLPSTVVATAGFDVLRDEGDAYAERLRQASVSVEHIRFSSMIHGFLNRGGILDQAQPALDEIAAAVRAALTPSALLPGARYPITSRTSCHVKGVPSGNAAPTSVKGMRPSSSGL
ncbi:MAG: lipase [Dehalococcoidia bacterium]|nr:lipase [Dehalococcoidia bacterium]